MVSLAESPFRVDWLTEVKNVRIRLGWSHLEFVVGIRSLVCTRNELISPFICQVAQNHPDNTQTFALVQLNHLKLLLVF